MSIFLNGGKKVTGIFASVPFKKISEFHLYGKATQDGTPTPESPVEIEVAGAGGSVTVTSCGKNLLKNAATTQTANGVTFTVNNGIVTANGTASDTSIENIIYADKPLVLKANEIYLLSGCPIGGGIDIHRIHFYDANTRKYIGSDVGEGFTYKPLNDTKVYCQIRIQKDTKVENLVFKPMLRKCDENGNPIGDDTYEPYKETTTTISTPNGLAGIPVGSGGNYTDESGQQWICDEIVKYVDGSGEHIKRIGVEIFDGSDDEIWVVNSTKSKKHRPYTKLFKNRIKPVDSNATIANIMCSQFIKNSANATYLEEDGTIGLEKSTDYLFIYSDEFNTSDITLWTNHLAANPMTVCYELAEPIYTPLTTEKLAELESLSTFYPVTNFSNDAGCGIDATVETYWEKKKIVSAWANKDGVPVKVFEEECPPPNIDS